MCNVEDSASKNFEELLQNYIKKLEEIIKNLDELKKTIASHHQTCNIAKTAGTAVSGTGVAMIVGSVLFAPVSGGGTLAVGAGGALMSVTGGISNVITDYVDYRTTTMIMNDIQSIVNSKEKFDENLTRQLKHFGMVIEKLIEGGVDKDSAIVIAVKGIVSGCIDLTEEPNMKLMNTLSTIVKLHHIESAALETLPIIGKTMHFSEKSFQFIYNFFGLTGHTGATVFKTIGRISSVISVAFTIVDMAFLVKDWTTEHPTVEIVLETEKKIDEEKTIICDLLQIIVSSKDDVQGVWEKMLKEMEAVEENELAYEHDFEIIDKKDIEV
ncbi:hypothetical protein JTB14_030968 [Gonioctena quinquepunctata]|nr:hypothetical protein JTB14_030968 [Gonioctena quinquepunctata]